MAQFQKFLKNSQRFFTSGDLDEQAYVDIILKSRPDYTLV